MVDHRYLFNPFFSIVNETWLVMMTGGDGFADFEGILNLQMGIPLTGTPVSFFRIIHKIDSSSLHSNNGCNGSQCTLFPGKNWKYSSWSETISGNFDLFPVKCRVKFQSVVSPDKKCISTNNKDSRSGWSCTDRSIMFYKHTISSFQLVGQDSTSVNENFTSDLSHAGRQSTIVQKKQDCIHHSCVRKKFQDLTPVVLIYFSNESLST